jgi:excisionase family DNA binding protein
LLSGRQMAKLLGVCPATVYALCDRGELPHFRILNAIRVDLEEVKALLRRWRRGTPTLPPKRLAQVLGGGRSLRQAWVRRGPSQEFSCPAE